MVGISLYLGSKTSSNIALVQGIGEAFRISSADFINEFKSVHELTKVLNLYTNSLLTQISQSAVCNRFHEIETRLARWLLMTQDRMGNSEFPITQEFLSDMLGVRREGVNKSALNLQQNGLISYSRGSMTILNRIGLEGAACSCYKVIKESYDNFLK